MSNKSERLYRVIGLLSDEKIANAEKHLDKSTSDSDEAVVSEVQSMPADGLRLTKCRRFLSMQFAGLAAAMLILAVGTVAMFHFLAPEKPDTREKTNNGTFYETESDEIYLGMPTSRVYELFGKPDYQASGLFWFGYTDIGTFDVMESFYDNNFGGIITRFNDWSISELINSAVKQHYTIPTDEYAAHSYRIMDIDANPKSFTMRILSQYATFLPDGEYDVVLTRDLYSPRELTFMKTSDNDYELTSYRDLSDGVRWDWADIKDRDSLVEHMMIQCRNDAMYFFVGAIKQDFEYRYGIGIGTAAVTNVAKDETRDEYFIIKCFPEAQFYIEPYDESWSMYGPGSWIIEYEDSGKNIHVGEAGTGFIDITEDLIGIYSVDEGRFMIYFEKYIREPT